MYLPFRQTENRGNRPEEDREGLMSCHFTRNITAFGPLCERDEEGFPVSDLVWHGDTPHPEKDPERLTCETLWLANSHKGNYHNNMTSEIFMKWVEQALFPTFEKLHPDKKGPCMRQRALSS